MADVQSFFKETRLSHSSLSVPRFYNNDNQTLIPPFASPIKSQPDIVISDSSDVVTASNPSTLEIHFGVEIRLIPSLLKDAQTL